ncbi:hypothetical protein DRO02_03080 [archaeon]|nr:MAG: hypothetical protein DRO21_05430 [archaeon]RLG65038.1 MAG: hypothetical protein DRO02_03080 [archaeon]HDM23756.1 hypothetical protein [Candidatus Bathyarchaeota archaeon]
MKGKVELSKEFKLNENDSIWIVKPCEYAMRDESIRFWIDYLSTKITYVFLHVSPFTMAASNIVNDFFSHGDQLYSGINFCIHGLSLSPSS